MSKILELYPINSTQAGTTLINSSLKLNNNNNNNNNNNSNWSVNF